jgi:serine/threonine protein kinase
VDPDVLRGRIFCDKSDIFSLGSLFFNLVCGRLLFSGRSAKEILYSNRNVNPQSYIDKTCINVSSVCRDLLKRMISPKQDDRPTAAGCLEHEWFN